MFHLRLSNKAAKYDYGWCSHIANTIRHAAVGAECLFCLDPALVLAGCCGQDSSPIIIFFPLRLVSLLSFMRAGSDSDSRSVYSLRNFRVRASTQI